MWTFTKPRHRGNHKSVPRGYTKWPTAGSMEFGKACPGRWTTGCKTPVGGLRKLTRKGLYSVPIGQSWQLCLQMPPEENAFPLLLIGISDPCFSLSGSKLKIYWKTFWRNVVATSPLWRKLSWWKFGTTPKNTHLLPLDTFYNNLDKQALLSPFFIDEARKWGIKGYETCPQSHS